MRIRQRRILLGITQETLGAAVGLSFQMIQKYEVAINCISASRLVEVAKALDVPPSFFFEGPRSTAKVPLYKRETLELVHAYTTISNSSVRHSIAETIQAIAATAPSDRRRS
jgi:transcriptional regulator with XRE-family HTH domain